MLDNDRFLLDNTKFLLDNLEFLLDNAEGVMAFQDDRMPLQYRQNAILLNWNAITPSRLLRNQSAFTL